MKASGASASLISFAPHAAFRGRRGAGRPASSVVVFENAFLKKCHAGFSYSYRARRLPRAAPRVAGRAPRGARASVFAAGYPRRPCRPDATREVDPLQRRLDAVRMAGARRRTRRLTDAADGAWRGPRGA